MQSETDSKGAAVKIPPPLIAALVILSAYGLHWLLPLPISTSSLLKPIGYCIVAIALLIIIIAALGFFRAKTHIEPWKPTTSIISNGIYAHSRNPIYLGFCIACVGIGLILNSYWVILSFIPLAGLLYYLVIRLEEKYLQNKFGEEYLTYRQTVRRWL